MLRDIRTQFLKENVILARAMKFRHYYRPRTRCACRPRARARVMITHGDGMPCSDVALSFKGHCPAPRQPAGRLPCPPSSKVQKRSSQISFEILIASWRSFHSSILSQTAAGLLSDMSTTILRFGSRLNLRAHSAGYPPARNGAPSIHQGSFLTIFAALTFTVAVVSLRLTVIFCCNVQFMQVFMPTLIFGHHLQISWSRNPPSRRRPFCGTTS